jgi:hypothetical protein
MVQMLSHNEPKNLTDLMDVIRNLVDATRLHQGFGKNSPMAAKRYDINTLASEMLGILNEEVGSGV